jgi:hypothetical protein
LLWKFAKQSGLSEIMIAEDDLRFSAKGAFEYFIENKADDLNIYLAGMPKT